MKEYSIVTKLDITTATPFSTDEVVCPIPRCVNLPCPQENIVPGYVASIYHN